MSIIGLPLKYQTLNGFMTGVVRSENEEGRFIIDIENGKQVVMSKFTALKLTEHHNNNNIESDQ